jgi:hypothetical protein
MNTTMAMMMNRWTALVGAAVLGISTTAAADSWNERTTFDFSAAVTVPGATLSPGEYEFRLLDTRSDRHLVRITRLGDDGPGDVVATTIAVPIKRAETTGDVVLKFDPTASGSPPALRAWFYPGSLYGHQFTYPEEQAREIARRTKTVVLSTDKPHSDAEMGTLRTYGPGGEAYEWHGDPATVREWDAWRQTHGAVAHADDESRKATAPAIQAPFRGMRVTVDDLEDHPVRYIGDQISVDAEVEDVYGPRLFTIDEPGWGDLEGEILVFASDAQAVPVRENDRVTISGTVKAFAPAEVAHEWGWRATDAATEGRLLKRPVLVANRIVGGDSDHAMLVQRDGTARDGGNASADALSALPPVMTNIDTVVKGDEQLVGRRVRLEGVRIGADTRPRGFFVAEGSRRLFILGSDKMQAPPAGARATIRGIVLQLPDLMADRIDAPEGANEMIYVLATGIDDMSKMAAGS